MSNYEELMQEASQGNKIAFKELYSYAGAGIAEAQYYLALYYKAVKGCAPDSDYAYWMNKARDNGYEAAMAEPVADDSEKTELLSGVANSSSENEEKKDFVYTSEWLKENTEISGWLTFFLIALSLGGAISAFYSVFSLNIDDYAGNYFLICADVLPGLSLLGVALYTIYLFVNRRPNAVFWGIVYVLVIIVTNLFSVCMGEFDNYGLNTLGHAVRGVLWGVIWLLYLTSSKLVKEVIPKEFRKIKKADWIVVACIVGLPIICFAIGYAQVVSEASKVVEKRELNESMLLKKELSENERTDGKIIFTIPDAFTCSEEDVEVDNGISIRIYNLENESSGNCTLCSDYDEDTSWTNFDTYRTNWKDTTTNKMIETDIDNGSKDIKGNTCIYKIVSYDADGVDVYWHFYLLFDKPTGKVAVVSAYDVNQDLDYVDKLLNSIRFQ